MKKSNIKRDFSRPVGRVRFRFIEERRTRSKVSGYVDDVMQRRMQDEQFVAASNFLIGNDILLPGDDVRLGLRGANVSRRNDGSLQVVPRISSRDYHQLMMTIQNTTNYGVIGAALNKYVQPGTVTWRNYMAVHDAVEDKGRFLVVRNVEPPFASPADMQTAAAGTNSKTRTYALTQLFSDSYVVDKFKLPVRFVERMRMLAVTDPASAARQFQEVMQKAVGYHVVVTSGEYATSVNRARSRIKQLAAGSKNMVPACVRSQVIGKDVLVFDSPDDVSPLMIKGPASELVTVMDVYAMCMRDRTAPVFLLAVELQRVGITVFVNDKPVSPIAERHVGQRGLSYAPRVSASVTLATLSSTVRVYLDRMARNILSVVVDGEAIASAIQLTSRTGLINQHVAETGGVFVAGRPIVGVEFRSHDLCVFDRSSDAPGWSFRSPNKGERVCIMCHNGDAVVYSEPFVVDSYTDAQISLCMDGHVRQGMSGGALVALADGALLGMHYGATQTHWLALPISKTFYADAIELEARDLTRTEQVVAVHENIMGQFRKRGILPLLRSIASTVRPLYDVDGVYVGTCYAMKDGYRTTCRPGEYRVGSVTTDLVEFVQLKDFVSWFPIALDSVMPSFRRPQVLERAIVLAATEKGYTMSVELVVRQTTKSRNSFFMNVDDRNVNELAGGLVVAVSDGAVLGTYVKSTMHSELGAMCLCTTMQSSAAVEMAPSYESVLNTLHPMSWPQEALEGVFTHSSARADGVSRQLAYALCGDAYARYVSIRNHLQAGVFDVRLIHEATQEMQTNYRMSSAAWQLGIADALKCQTGVNFPATSKAYADLMEAVIGAASLYEAPGDLENFMSRAGVCMTVNQLMQPPLLEMMSPRLEDAVVDTPVVGYFPREPDGLTSGARAASAATPMVEFT